ncbi:hypothetical protein ABID22_000756 [Pontibacter aydingkolensis]
MKYSLGHLQIGRDLPLQINASFSRFYTVADL